MSKILLNDKTEIDLPKLIESRLLVQANSGGGKSWLIRRLLEQTHGKVQQIVIDPEGEFSSLREKFDYILAGKEGDTPADPRSAGLLAHKLLELNVSAIIDLYELHPQERKRFVRLFLEAMINSPKSLHHPCLVVIDEAHTFAPEKGQSEAMDAVIGLCSLGRKRKFCAVLATQRISKLHKDAAAECNNKLIGRTGLDIDRKRAGEELGFTTKEQIISLRTLAPGEFYAFGPAISNEVIKVPVGPVKTTHAATGDLQQTKIVPPTSKIKALLPQLADLPAEAKKEAQTVSELKNENSQLRRDLVVAKRAPGAAQVKIEKIEVPAIGKHTLKGLLEINSKFLKLSKQTKEFTELAQINFDKFFREMEKINQPIKFGSSLKVDILQTTQLKPAYKIENTQTFPMVSDSSITGPEQKVLNALAWCESIGIEKPSNEIVAFLSGYSHFRSTGYTNPRGYLKGKGLIDYQSGCVFLLPAGRELAEQPIKPLTQEELHRAVLDRLDGPERKLLTPLLEKYPEGISNTELCAAAGYMHERSTGYTNPRGRLKSFGLVEYGNGEVKARKILFI